MTSGHLRDWGLVWRYLKQVHESQAALGRRSSLRELRLDRRPKHFCLLLVLIRRDFECKHVAKASSSFKPAREGASLLGFKRKIPFCSLTKLCVRIASILHDRN